MEEAKQEKTTRVKATEGGRKIPEIVKRVLIGGPIKAKEEGKPTAYCFISSLYDEIVRAMDIMPIWVENYAGVVAAKRAQDPFLSKAEAEGYSKSLCTYATCDLGFDALRCELGGTVPDAPWGGMPQPDMILGTGMEICDPRYKWPQTVQRYMSIPTHVIGIPWPPYGSNLKELESPYVKYITEQLHGLVEFIEKQIKRKMDWDRLWNTIDIAEKTYKLWWEINALRAKTRPTPMGTEDSMNTMVPGTFMLGTQEALEFYQDLFREVKERADNGIGLVPEEKYRVMWGGGLPPWFALSDFEHFKSHGAVFPADNSYKPFWEPFEMPKCADPLEHLAWRWTKFWTYRYEKASKRLGSHPDVETLIDCVEKAGIDGILMHLAFSCRSWHVGLIQQLNTLKKVYKDIPSLILESDMVDPRSYSEADTHARIDAFIETMETYKNK